MTLTYLARLTPPGTAALATLALHGPDAWAMIRGLFTPTLPDEPQPGTFRLGRLGDELGRDEVVLTTKPAERWPVFEIHCHGGQQVLQWLAEIIEKRGAVLCSWPDLQRHLGSPAWQVAALEALAHAPTVRTAAILLDQYQGAWSKALAQIADHIQAGTIAQARQHIDTLLARTQLGRHLVEPWRVVIAGAVNVGKSSLVNAMAGHTRTVVSPQPGTTRDVVTVQLALDGWPVEVSDTAGWRGAADPLEQAGLALAQAAMQQADLIVWVLDGAAALPNPGARPGGLVVINKTDLAAAWDFQQMAGALPVSARTGAGVTTLCQHIASLLVPNPPAPGEAVPVTPWLGQSLAKARDLLAEGDVAAAQSILGELAS